MSAVRDVVFISHANPEDCQFAKWLAARLVAEGYKVWSDDTALLCGDDAWADIEAIIRHETAKFIFVGSHASNHKPGVLKEVHVAAVVERRQKLNDFILPVILDDLPFSELNIEVARLLCASFRSGWSSGLAQLLARLEKDGVPRSGPGPKELATWWRRRNGALVGVQSRPETCQTNLYPISDLPSGLSVARPTVEARQQLLAGESRFPVAALGHERVIALGADLGIPGLVLSPLSSSPGGGLTSIPESQLGRSKVELLRLAWERLCRSRGLHEHPLSNGRTCFYFKLDQLPGNSVSFVDIGAKRRTRSLVGFKTMLPKDGAPRLRRWHLAVEAKPLLFPMVSYALKLHILFSNDGQSVWKEPKRLHRARRSQGKNWWNDDWRDRGLGFMAWLAGEREFLDMPFAVDKAFRVGAKPFCLTFPASYNEEAFDGPIAEDLVDDDGDTEEEGAA